MSKPGPRLLHGVKFMDGEFYLRCGACHRAHRACYWPMTLEFWRPNLGLGRCKACWNTYRRIALNKRDRRIERKTYYEDAHDVILFKKREHYYANHQRILARRRELYWAKKAAA